LSQNTEGVTRLRHTENTLQFNFSSLDFDNPEKVSFRYRLEGFDENWMQADARRQANYTNLDAGNYVFTVQVANANGEWLSSRSFKFKIVPPFYLTFWFLALVGVAILGLVYAFYQYRVGQILKVQEMRNRIAADLHDEVGSTLSSISILSELAVFQRNESHQLMEQISENARDTIDKMDDIVWAINPDNDLLFDLESRVKTFAVPLFESKNIDFSIQFGEATQNIKLNLEQRRNVFLILKEAINNLVKYSQARKAAVICTRLNNQLIFNVKDDGIGFDLTAPTDRNGLKNMRQRAERIGGHLTIESAVGQGTSVTAQLKI
jgi:signal transduction histidine kinase